MSVSARMGVWLSVFLATTAVYLVLWINTPLREIGTSGTFTYAVALLLVLGGLFSVRRAWRPELATALGWILAGFAWFTAVVYDTSTPVLTSDSNSMVLGVAACATVYAVAVKPLADTERRAADEVRLRQAIRDELRDLGKDS